MTVLRSCQQSLRRCRRMPQRTTKKNLVVVAGYRNNEHALFLSPRRHEFSTSSTIIDELKPKRLPPRVLEVASNQARQVLCTQQTVSSSTCPKEATEAAQAMLTLTSPTKPLAEAIRSKKAMADQVACLHRAFLAVTSWCISFQNVELLEWALDLARRAQDLSLPLHLPLYRSMATAIGQHYTDEPSVVIMEVSLLAASALKVTLQASFFADALVALVERYEVQEAIYLLNQMKDRHDIHSLDSKIAMDILQVLNQVLQEKLKDDSLNVDETHLNQLSSILREPLLKELEENKKELAKKELSESIAAALLAASENEDSEAIEDVIKGLSLEEVSSDDDEDDSDDALEEEEMDTDDDEEEDWTAEFLGRLDTDGKNAREIAASLEKMLGGDKKKKGLAAAVVLDVNEETGDIENFSVTLPSQEEELTDKVAREEIYIRDSNSWILPDVTHQLQQHSNGETVLYTKEYELQIFRDMRNIDAQEQDF